MLNVQSSVVLALVHLLKLDQKSNVWVLLVCTINEHAVLLILTTFLDQVFHKQCSALYLPIYILMIYILSSLYFHYIKYMHICCQLSMTSCHICYTHHSNLFLPKDGKDG